MSLSDALRLTERIAKHLRKDGRDTIFWGLASPALLCSSLPSGAGRASFGSTKCILKSNVSLRCRPNLTNDFQMAIRHHVPPPLRKMDLKHDAHEDVIAFLRELRDGSTAASRTMPALFPIITQSEVAVVLPAYHVFVRSGRADVRRPFAGTSACETTAPYREHARMETSRNPVFPWRRRAHNRLRYRIKLPRSERPALKCRLRKHPDGSCRLQPAEW